MFATVREIIFMTFIWKRKNFFFLDFLFFVFCLCILSFCGLIICDGCTQFIYFEQKYVCWSFSSLLLEFYVSWAWYFFWRFFLHEFNHFFVLMNHHICLLIFPKSFLNPLWLFPPLLLQLLLVCIFIIFQIYSI